MSVAVQRISASTAARAGGGSPLLLGLRIDPVADHLLLGAHVLDEALDRFGEIGHRVGRGLARSGVADRLLEPVDRELDLGRRRRPPTRPRLGVDAEIAHRGREPVLELGVEAVLRLARSAGRGSRAPASRRGRTARTRTRCPCRRAARRGLPSASRTPRRRRRPTFSFSMTPPTEPTVSIRPQNVPSRPRKTSRPVM